MMTTPNLKTVELTRQIRDRHYEQLKGKTHAERIAFYEQKAQAWYAQRGITPGVSPAAERKAG